MEPQPFRRIEVVCKCVPPRLVPVRLHRDMVALLASHHLPPDTVVMTYKCRRCGIVHVTIKQIRAA